ncbi:hypothetical protein C8Q80DRAFT_369886 [Daedaleopsis nitida]|nr:hypothetical protein C8Q80DRAFT_369886 [Daedaleopsis nitida]
MTISTRSSPCRLLGSTVGTTANASTSSAPVILSGNPLVRTHRSGLTTCLPVALFAVPRNVRTQSLLRTLMRLPVPGNQRNRPAVLSPTTRAADIRGPVRQNNLFLDLRSWRCVSFEVSRIRPLGLLPAAYNPWCPAPSHVVVVNKRRHYIQTVHMNSNNIVSAPSASHSVRGHVDLRIDHCVRKHGLMCLMHLAAESTLLLLLRRRSRRRAASFDWEHGAIGLPGVTPCHACDMHVCPYSVGRLLSTNAWAVWRVAKLKQVQN